jgi:quinol monooxygenase YgiN
MLIVHVYVHVRPECIDAFYAASLDNASHSVLEPGVARFDVLQELDDPARFMLIEMYRTADAPAAHKQTAHYARWRDTVESMMAEPRRSVKLRARFPEPARFEMPHDA